MPKINYEAKITSFYRVHKRMPNITEVMRLCRFRSRSSAFYLVEKLVKAGVIEKDSRGRLSPGSELHALRLLGAVRAGFAAPVEEELLDTVSIGEYLIRHKESSYLLRVEGDSMRDAGIHHGDMVIFERRADASVGDLVVALTEDGYTLKFLRKRKSKIYLEAANSVYPEIHPKEGQVIGVVTATFRKYHS